jgi:hypothetical protein
VFVDAAKVTTPQRHAMAIEEFKNLDRHLAAVVEPIAELGGGEAIRRFGREVGGDVRHFGDCAAKKEMIARHFVDLADAAGEFEQMADLRFADPC